MFCQKFRVPEYQYCPWGFIRYEGFIWIWIRDHSCHIWVKDLILFNLCPEILSVPEWGVAYLTREVAQQYTMQTVAWLLIALFSQIYSAGTEQQWEQKYMKNVQIFLGKKYELV